ncbi:HAUS augmin-like complex subunit 1 [Esox lucius]|uniref:Coiled-coil domain-containing protein 5 n=1 Tax=Esox lucius TaxID=8010 RepID=C1BY08_ESOLU|nr:HAUS augmin-like complex subunit 1 [Esox lucius]ACO13911.1 Coiled-coil domain-containing protein 5 [Esox lucius]
MCEKNKKVSRWLRTVFGDQTIIEYEVNTRTIDLLYQLAEASALRCKETSLLIEDHQQKASEYQADGVHLQDVVLQAVGLSTGSLSKPSSDYLTALVENAMVLGTRDTSLSSLVPAVNNLTNELLESEKTDRRLDREPTAIRKKLGDALVLRKTLQEDVQKTLKAQEVESAKAEERLLNMDFVKAKSKDLLYRNKKAEDQLASRCMENRLSHQTLLELSEQVSTLKQEILPLAKKLEPYRDLSPSPSLAIVKIEEAKRELAAIDAQLEMKVDLMNSSIPKGRPLK